MNRTQQDRILTELLAGEEIVAFRERSLEQMLSTARQRRARRRAFVAFGLALMPVLLVVGLLLRPSAAPVETAGNASRPKPLPTSASHASGIQMINDQQLCALFPNRSFALIGKPGNQRFIFLDAGGAGEEH